MSARDCTYTLSECGEEQGILCWLKGCWQEEDGDIGLLQPSLQVPLQQTVVLPSAWSHTFRHGPVRQLHTYIVNTLFSLLHSTQLKI